MCTFEGAKKIVRYTKKATLQIKKKNMDKDYFLLKDKIKEIESNFIKNGWITAYCNGSKDDDQSGIYCCLINKSEKEKYENRHDWPLSIGCEGKPTIYGDKTYKTYDTEGLEPFLFRRIFTLADRYERYFDVSEEFVLYFNLYEQGENKQNRKYYFINEIGDLDEVIIIEPERVKIKLKYLKEYITIRDMNFIVCYDFMRLIPIESNNWQIKFFDKTFKSSNYVYNHLVRFVMGEIQSWIIGNVFIEGNDEKKTYFDFDERKYENFIIGYNENGAELFEDCSKTNDKYFKVTYFKKAVLDKYYNEPNRYKVDGFAVKSKFFTLKIDNNIEDYVPVFLVELGYLPFTEQLHWKQYNIPPQNGMTISKAYYKTMIEGNWAEQPETPDLYFKSKYQEFNKSWEKKFGWKFYKTLAKEDEHIFTSLHIPTTNNIKSFCEQVLSIVKLTIDRLNEKEFGKNIELEKNDKGITKLEKFLRCNGINLPDMFEFLRNLQSLRSGLIAHSFSESDNNCKKAIEYFEINKKDYNIVAKDIFVKSINTLNTLENHFLKENTLDSQTVPF